MFTVIQRFTRFSAISPNNAICSYNAQWRNLKFYNQGYANNNKINVIRKKCVILFVQNVCSVNLCNRQEIVRFLCAPVVLLNKLSKQFLHEAAKAGFERVEHSTYFTNQVKYILTMIHIQCLFHILTLNITEKLHSR